jgi:hypothetical protein
MVKSAREVAGNTKIHIRNNVVISGNYLVPDVEISIVISTP